MAFDLGDEVCLRSRTLGRLVPAAGIQVVREVEPGFFG